MNELERRKAVELLREMRQDEGVQSSTGRETRLTWMYKGPQELVDREEYLLGKAIDKSFDGIKNGNSSEIISRNTEPSNVPKHILSKPESTEQVDIKKKILEDPLYAIKQKEMEARRKLLDNPVKLKQLQKMIMERNLEKQHKKEEKHKKRKKHKLQNGTADEKYLDKLILKKLKRLNEPDRKKILEEIAYDLSESKEKIIRNDRKRKSSRDYKNDRSTSRKKEILWRKNYSEREKFDLSRKKHRPLERKIYDNSSSKEKKKIRFSKNKVRQSHTNSSSSSNSDSQSTSGSSSSSLSNSESSSDDSSTYASSTEEIKARHKIKKSDKGDQRKFMKSSKTSKETDKTKYRAGISGKKTENKYRLKRKNSSDEFSSGSENKRHEERLNLKDRNKPVFSSRSGEKGKSYSEYGRKVSSVPERPKMLSEKEREAKLKEMMENAKIRKEDREKNLATHRKKQSQEEKLNDYDDGFMRRQISHATSQKTMADRIRSNVNNIQRSQTDMDRSFVRK